MFFLHSTVIGQLLRLTAYDQRDCLRPDIRRIAGLIKLNLQNVHFISTNNLYERDKAFISYQMRRLASETDLSGTRELRCLDTK